MRRRQLLSKSLAATVGIGTVVTPVGATKDRVGAEEAGIKRPVSRLLRNRRWDQATALMDRNDVEYKHHVVGMPVVSNPVPQESDVGSDGVSTQAEYNRTNSKFAHTVFLLSGSVYRSSLQWTLEYKGEELNACIDSAGPPDGVSVGFSQTYWEPVIDTWRFGSNTTLYERDPQGVIGSFDDPDYNPLPGACSGLTTKVPSPERRSSWMRVDIRKKQPGAHNVYGTYAHTWKQSALPGNVNFSLSLGILSVSTTFTADHWKKRNDRNI